MFVQLGPNDFWQAKPLTASLKHNLSLAAVMEGMSKGWIYCDDPDHPSSAFIGTMEGYFLAGKADNQSFNAGVRTKIGRLIAGDTVRPNTQYIEFAFSDSDWDRYSNASLLVREPLTYLSRYYRCSELRMRNWRDFIPSGYEVRLIDEHILHQSQGGLELVEDRDSHFHPYEWALGFGSIHKYMEHGFGFVVMDEARMLSWSMSDCVAENQAEIGIYTLPEYRQQGLGSLAVGAAVEFGLSRGMDAVGWHCNDGNLASQRHAEKVGFVHQKTFKRHYIHRTAWRHLAELALRDFHNGNFEACVEKYREAFQFTREAEDYVYHLAAMAAARVGEFDLSFAWLEEATQRGWKNLSYSESRNEFAELKGSPGWEGFVRRVRKNQDALERRESLGGS